MLILQRCEQYLHPSPSPLRHRELERTGVIDQVIIVVAEPRGTALGRVSQDP
jgi:hypothetical protein